MRVLVGCPVLHRAWILPRWFEHVAKAANAASVMYGFVFVTDTRDTDTLDTIHEHAPNAEIINVPSIKGDDSRRWDQHRYNHLIELRNTLLARVREHPEHPELFLSLDSDILLHPSHLHSMIEALAEPFDAVGAKCYMTASGTQCPSWANLGRDGQLIRSEANGLFEVDVIMAAKLMTPAAYHVDYRFSLNGEDIGWSIAARQAGLRLGWDGRFVSKHVMRPSMLDVVDLRVGF